MICDAELLVPITGPYSLYSSAVSGRASSVSRVTGILPNLLGLSSTLVGQPERLGCWKGLLAPSCSWLSRRRSLPGMRVKEDGAAGTFAFFALDLDVLCVGTFQI